MQASYNRRTATKVKNGRVQRKNRHVPTGHLGCMLDREPAGRGFRHVVTKRDVQAFIEIIPNWSKFSERLERIMLARRDYYLDGSYVFYHREETGGIFLNAWNEDLWVNLNKEYFDAHREIFERLAVSHEPTKDTIVCRFTEAQARAFMLLHVFIHEVGHHYYRLHQKHHGPGRGEDFAERFATSRFNDLYPAYVRAFGDPATT